MTGAPDRFQPAADRDARVELLGFQQTIMRGIEIIALDVETGQGQALARGFLGMFVGRADFAHALTQRDRSRVMLERRLQTLQSSIRRAVLDKKFGIKQRSFNFANGLFMILVHISIKRVSAVRLSREGNSPPKSLQILTQPLFGVR